MNGGDTVKVSRTYICLLCFTASVLLSLPLTIEAVENDYGILHAWVRFQDGDWQDAGITNVTLKVHEPFDLKVTVETKVRCNVYLEVFGPGITQTYETVDGPSRMGTGNVADYIDNYDCPIGWNQTYEWVVRPTGNWTQGTAPLNLQVFFTKLGEKEKIALGVINAYISQKEWEGSLCGIHISSDDTTSQNTSGFEGVFLLILFVIIATLKRKKQR